MKVLMGNVLASNTEALCSQFVWSGLQSWLTFWHFLLFVLFLNTPAHCKTWIQTASSLSVKVPHKSCLHQMVDGKTSRGWMQNPLATPPTSQPLGLFKATLHCVSGFMQSAPVSLNVSGNVVLWAAPKKRKTQLQKQQSSRRVVANLWRNNDDDDDDKTLRQKKV